MLIYICDDDREFANELASYVMDYFDNQCDIHIFETADSILSAMTSSPDIAILDIRIGQNNGIDLGKQIHESGENKTQIIYVTGYIEYCTAVYETDHVYFILKPVQILELNKALSKAVQAIHSTDMNLFIRYKGEIIPIPLSDILYIESYARKLTIVATGYEYQIPGGFSSLPDYVQNSFVRCHKSFLVNPRHVSSILYPTTGSNHFFLLDNGQKLSISQALWRECKRDFLRVLTEKPMFDLHRK